MKRPPSLTAAQRCILTAAARKGGTVADQHHTSTVELLEVCGLVTLHDLHDIGEWTILITNSGRRLLHLPVPDTVTWLAARSEHIDPGSSQSGYTTFPHLAMPGEPEAVPPGSLHAHWRQEAAKRHAGQRERREAARRVSRGMRAA